MHIRHLELTHFRNHISHRVALHPKSNLIVGPNAVGKTTLLEAIYLGSTGRSFRTHHLNEMIHWKAERFRLVMAFEKCDIGQFVSVNYGKNAQENSVYYNRTRLSGMRALHSTVPCITMHPKDVMIIRGGPSERRQFLDELIGQLDPLYHHHLNRYQGTLKQRNAVLKSGKKSMIATYDTILASSGSYIVLKREETIRSLDAIVLDKYQHLGGRLEPLQLIYQPSVAFDLQTTAEGVIENALLEAFQRNLERDLKLGQSTVGPHRDEMNILIEMQDASEYASEGQTRSCAAALKMAEWDYLRQHTSIDPIMLIDDFGMGLDLHRRQRLLKELPQLGQVIITSTVHEEGFGEIHCLE